MHMSDAQTGKIFVTDGYGNSAVHRFAPDGTHQASWGAPGTVRVCAASHRTPATVREPALRRARQSVIAEPVRRESRFEPAADSVLGATNHQAPGEFNCPHGICADGACRPGLRVARAPPLLV